MIRVRLWRWGDYSGCSGETLNVITVRGTIMSSLQEGGRGRFDYRKGKDYVTMERNRRDGERRRCLLLALKMDREARSQGMQKATRSRGRARKPILPSEPSEGNSRANILTFTQWNWFWTSDFPNYKLKNLCCFKLWSLYSCYISNRKPTHDPEKCSNYVWYLQKVFRRLC